jgi:hypothetical protein
MNGRPKSALVKMKDRRREKEVVDEYLGLPETCHPKKQNPYDLGQQIARTRWYPQWDCSLPFSPANDAKKQ